MKRSMVAMSALFSLNACQSLVDYSPRYNGDCYQLVKPVLLYKTRCPGTTGFMSGLTECLGIQSFPIKIVRQQETILESFDHYLAQPKFWNEQLFDTYQQPYTAVIDGLPTGARFEIKHVQTVTREFDDPYWSVAVQFTSGEHQGRQVILPTHVYHLGPTWSMRDPYFGELVLNDEYVVRCE